MCVLTAVADMSSKRLVPCPCPCCHGKRVSPYTRKRHSDLYISRCQVSSEQGACVDQSYTSDDVSASRMMPEVPVDDVDDDSQPVETAVESEDESGGPDDLLPLDSPSNSDLAYDTVLGCTDPEGRMPMYNSVDLAVTPLYENAPTTVLEAIKHHLTWFTNHRSISKEALSDILHTLHHQILPSGNSLPDSYGEAMKLIKDYLIRPIIYHCCPNDCVAFRGEFADSVVCPTCGAERYSRNKIPSKSFTYFPIGPRIVRMFESPVYSKLIQDHAASLQEVPEVVYDIHHSGLWKEAYKRDGIFNGDGRGISLAICADGVNPFHINRVQYSMCPIVMSLLNLPRHLRYQFSNLLLVGIIPGPKEPHNMNIYLDILVDELLELNTRRVYDAHLKEIFHLNVRILSYVLDYPGIGKLFHTMGSGAYQGCLWCEIQGVRNAHLQKVIYLENRRFLPDTSELRKDSISFPSKTREIRPPPPLRCYVTVNSVHKAYDKAKNKSQAAAIAKATGCKGSYPLMNLPAHNRLSQTVPDMMHTLKDSVNKLFDVVAGKDSDGGKVQKAESEIGRFQDGVHLHASKRRRINNRESSTQITHPVYRITPEEIKLANLRATSICSPSEFSPGCIFTKSSALKSHDWKELTCSGLLKYCLRGMLGNKQRTTLFFFLDTLSLACSEGISSSLADDVEERLHTSLALIERDFPMSVQDITTHILHHVADGLRMYGPVYSTWMYPYERFNSWMCRRAMNRRRPEATIIETYRIFEWCHFASVSGLLSSTTASNNSPTLVSSGVEKELTDAEFKQLDTLYTQLNPRYKYLCKEYDTALARAANMRSKSLLPSQEKWQPPFPISSNDRELLCGPAKNVLIHKRHYMEEPNTKRMLLFTSSESESTTCRTAYSYVQINSDSVRVGCIIKIIYHEFAGTVYHLAVVQEYHDKFIDPDSKLWWVNIEHSSSAIFPFSSLSRPLL